MILIKWGKVTRQSVSTDKSPFLEDWKGEPRWESNSEAVSVFISLTKVPLRQFRRGFRFGSPF